MNEAPDQQRNLSEVVHQLLADRLARSGTPEEQEAWINLATWVRGRVEELLHRYPYPQPDYFDGLCSEIEARPEMTAALAHHLDDLRAAFNTVRAQIFKGRIGAGRIEPIIEHVTLGNKGAQHDLKICLERLAVSDVEGARPLAISATQKATSPLLLRGIAEGVKKAFPELAIEAYDKALDHLSADDHHNAQQKTAMAFSFGEALEFLNAPQKAQRAYTVAAELLSKEQEGEQLVRSDNLRQEIFRRMFLLIERLNSPECLEAAGQEAVKLTEDLDHLRALAELCCDLGAREAAEQAAKKAIQRK